jgi:lipopolysaccharide/colanic/teichoic acid biosynthesis glycosyltransferase
MDTEQAYRAKRPLSWSRGDSGNEESRAAVESATRSGEAQSRPVRSIFGCEWAPAALFLFLDVSCWALIYGTISFLRGDAFYSTPLQFFLIDVLQLGVIGQAIFIIGGYSRNTEMRSLTYTAEHILAITAALAVSSLLIYVAATFDQSMKPSRGVILLSFVAFLPLSILYRRAFSERIASTAAKRAFLVIGSGKVAAEFYETYQRSPNLQQLEFVDPNDQRVGELIAGKDSPAIEGNCEEKLANLGHRYSGVILVERFERLGKNLVENLVRTQFQRARVYTLESFYEAHWRHVPLHAIDPVWPLQMGFQLARNSPYHYLKRLFDLALSTTLLIIFAPLFAIIALLIWMEGKTESSLDARSDQPGGPSLPMIRRPIIFRQERVGRGGQPFVAYKFRTMVVNSSEGPGDIYTRKNDPRVTRSGRWIRKLRLDELPQLFNVFRGEMSLIGPRAEWIRCAERYEKAIPLYHFRHLVKPGITGWAQVNYPYGESDEDAIEKLKYDLYYIRHYSLTLDAMIVLKTVHTMLFSKGR